jgi:hypothetical protein
MQDVRVEGGVRREITLNFVRMSVCFSLNHACVTAALALSTSNLGRVLGNASNAMLYIGYTSSALLLASPYVRARGPKASLVDATAAFSLYVGSFCVAEAWGEVAWVAAIGGSLLGGVAAGVLFTAQGLYFALSADAYARAAAGGGGDGGGAGAGQRRARGVASASPQQRESATALLGGVFASIYLLCEVSFKLLAGLLPRLFGVGWAAVSLVYFLFALASAAAMSTIWALGSPPTAAAAPRCAGCDGLCRRRAKQTATTVAVPAAPQARAGTAAPTTDVEEKDGNTPIVGRAGERASDGIGAGGAAAADNDDDDDLGWAVCRLF